MDNNDIEFPTVAQLYKWYKEFEEGDMPCCTPTTSKTACNTCGKTLFECTGALKMEAHICEQPTNCGTACKVHGLQLNVYDVPDTGAGPLDYTSIFRIVDCENPNGSRFEAMVYWEGVLKQGFGAVVPASDGAAAARFGLTDPATGLVIPSTLVTFGVQDATGKQLAMRVDGDMQVAGSIVDAAGKPVSGGSGTSLPTSAYANDLFVAGNTLRLLAADGHILKSVTLPTGSTSVGLTSVSTDKTLTGQGTPSFPLSVVSIAAQNDAIFSKGPVDLGGPHTAYNTSYYYKQASVNNTWCSLMEFLDPTGPRRVSLIPNAEGGSTQALWVLGANAPGSFAGQYSITDGTYYGSVAGGPTVCLAGTLNSGQKVAAWFDGDVILTNGNAIGWADRIFDHDYVLPDVKDIVDFALTNGHLEGIVSSEDYEKNGFSIGDHTAKTLMYLEMSMRWIADLKETMKELVERVRFLENANA